MSHNLKHPFIYVLELNRIVTPAKARLAFLSNMNRYHEFHFYCRHCGVKLSGKNITKPKLGDKNQQPNCSDWPNVKHKPNCQSLTISTTGGTGGTTGGGTPPNSDIFIPEYLTFEAPNFVINQPDIIPEEIDTVILNTAPVDFEVTELKNPNSTYLLSDVLDAWFHIEEQIYNKLQQLTRLTNEEIREQEKALRDQSPKLQLGTKGYLNRYGYLIRELTQLYSTQQNPVIYNGKFELKYTKITDDFFTFRPTKQLYLVKIENNDGTCFYKIGNLTINIERRICTDTALGKTIDILSNMKKDRTATLDGIIDFYITGHKLPTNHTTKINDNKNEIHDYIIDITNPHLIVLIPPEKLEIS